MLATAMNALAVADALEHLGVEVRVQTALSMQQIAEPYIRNRAIRHLEKKGESSFWPAERATRSFHGHSFGAARCGEINADIIFKATMVDGVYDKDPKNMQMQKNTTRLRSAVCWRTSLP